MLEDLVVEELLVNVAEPDEDLVEDDDVEGVLVEEPVRLLEELLVCVLEVDADLVFNELPVEVLDDEAVLLSRADLDDVWDTTGVFVAVVVENDEREGAELLVVVLVDVGVSV